MKILLVIPFMVLFSLASCKREDQNGTRTAHELLPPLVVRTALADTLPVWAIQRLKLEHTQGIKVKYATGQHVSYFDYEANRSEVLNTMGKLPFSKYAPLADTLCRRVPITSIELMKSIVSQDEVRAGFTFWEVDVNEFDVYECIKAPFRHTLLISKQTPRVIHRIEYNG